MTLPSIFPPAILPVFGAAEHGVAEGPTYGDLKRGRGLGRKRALYSGAPRLVSVVWPVLTEAQMLALDVWFEESIVVGETHWTAEIANQGPGQRFFEAVWPEPFRREPQPSPQGTYWRVTGRLVIIGEGEAVRTDDFSLSGRVLVELTGDGGELAVDFSLSGRATVALLPAIQLSGRVVIALTIPTFLQREDGTYFEREDGSGGIQREN
jgi:hypothetical protein